MKRPRFKCSIDHLASGHYLARLWIGGRYFYARQGVGRTPWQAVKMAWKMGLGEELEVARRELAGD